MRVLQQPQRNGPRAETTRIHDATQIGLTTVGQASPQRSTRVRCVWFFLFTSVLAAVEVFLAKKIPGDFTPIFTFQCSEILSMSMISKDVFSILYTR